MPFVFLIAFVLWGIYHTALAQSIPVPGVHINEFLPNPVGNDGELEFIELINNSDRDIDVSGWIVDTGGSFTFSIDTGTTIAPGEFLTFFSADKRISLTNSGDHIQLVQLGGVVQDDIAFTGSEEGRSYVRTDAGLYEGGKTPTPNAANTVIVSPTPSPTVSPTPTPSASPTPMVISYSNLVYINEFLPDPTGDDALGEFVELYSADTAIVDLSGWTLDDMENGGSSPFLIPEDTNILPGGFLLLHRTQTKLSMNNDSDHVRFIRPDGVLQDNVSYMDTREGHSYNRISAGSYEKSSTITPNAVNIITTVSTPTPKPKAAEEEEKEGDISYDFSSKIVINEFLPNPIDADTDSEFIELKSEDTKIVQLFGWTLDDGVGGSSPYYFTKEESISPGKILVLFRKKTKIALNNDEDVVRLIDPNGKIISSQPYNQKIVEGQSYNRTPDSSFAWSEIPTPGEENIISIQLKASPTPKPKAAKKVPTSKKSSSVKKSTSVTIPRVLSLSTALPWPARDKEEGSVSQSVVTNQAPFQFPRGRQGMFVFFGVTAAFMQGLSGFSNKERIWQK